MARKNGKHITRQTTQINGGSADEMKEMEDMFNNDDDSTNKGGGEEFTIEFDENGEFIDHQKDTNIFNEAEEDVDDTVFENPEDDNDEVFVDVDSGEMVDAPEEEEDQQTKKTLTLPEEKPDKKEEKPKKDSSSQKRIRQLARKQKQLEEELRKAREENTKWQSQVYETQSTYAKMELQRLEKELINMQESLQRAIEDGDSTRTAEITSNLAKTHQDISALKHYVQDDAPKSVQGQNNVNSQNNTSSSSEGVSLSEAAEEWMLGKEFILDNNEYKNLDVQARKKLSPVRREMTKVARELLAEGFANDDPSFYEEMDLRLQEKFDFYEELALNGVDALSYNSNDKETSDSTGNSSANNDVKRGAENNTSSTSAQTKQQNQTGKNVPVKGSSNVTTSSKSGNNSSSNSRFKLSKADYKWFKNHLEPNGMTLKEYVYLMKKDQANNG